MDAKIKQMLDLVREYVKGMIEPFAKRLDEIEKRQPERGADGAVGAAGKDGRDGINGKDGAPGKDGIGERGERGEKGENGSDGAKGEIGARGELGAQGKDGRDGVDGKNGELGAAGRDGVDGKEGAPGKDGAAGLDGVNGKDGTPGRDGLDGKDGAPGKDGNAGLDGVHGKDGTAGRDGVDGKNGEPGNRGADGKSVTIDDVMPFHEAWFAKWALSVERRIYESAERAIGSMPKPKDGRDGISAKDIELVDGRVLRMTFPDGTVKDMLTGLPLYQGMFKEGTDYQLNDFVTFGGNIWIATEAKGLKEKPGAPGNNSWRLAVRKGSDGRDAR